MTFDLPPPSRSHTWCPMGVGAPIASAPLAHAPSASSVPPCPAWTIPLGRGRGALFWCGCAGVRVRDCEVNETWPTAVQGANNRCILCGTVEKLRGAGSAGSQPGCLSVCLSVICVIVTTNVRRSGSVAVSQSDSSGGSGSGSGSGSMQVCMGVTSRDCTLVFAQLSPTRSLQACKR